MYFSQVFITKIYRIGFFVILLLVLLDLLTFFYYPDTTLADIFLATREQTPLTWISSLTFLFIALSCFSVYQKIQGWVWYLLSATFFFFSMDDATYFHERFSGFVFDNTTFLSSFPSYIWVVLYMPLLLFSLVALTYFLWEKANAQQKKIIVGSLVLLGCAIFLDLLDGFMQKNEEVVFCLSAQCHVGIVHIMRLTEEVMEVIALGLLGYLHLIQNCVHDSIVVDKELS